MSLVYLLFDIGNGFMVVARTHINYLLGAGLPQAAKKLALMIYASGFAGCSILGLSLFFLRAQFASLLSSNEGRERDYLLTLAAIYSLAMQTDVAYMLMSGISRITNHTVFSSCTVFFFCLVVNAALCSWLLHTGSLNCISIFMVMYFCSTAAVSLVSLKILLYDWFKIALFVSQNTPLVSVYEKSNKTSADSLSKLS